MSKKNIIVNTPSYLSKKKVADTEGKQEPSLYQIATTVTYFLRRLPIVEHPVKISAGVAGQVIEHKIVQAATLVGLPESAIRAFDLAMTALLCVLLLKWVAEALLDSFFFIKTKWGRNHEFGIDKEPPASSWK